MKRAVKPVARAPGQSARRSVQTIRALERADMPHEICRDLERADMPHEICRTRSADMPHDMPIDSCINTLSFST
jgi:hypothetical protein